MLTKAVILDDQGSVIRGGGLSAAKTPAAGKTPTRAATVSSKPLTKAAITATVTKAAYYRRTAEALDHTKRDLATAYRQMATELEATIPQLRK